MFQKVNIIILLFQIHIILLPNQNIRFSKEFLLEKILDKAYTGKLYKWNTKSAAIKMPDGKTRRTNISGDYMFAIPSERNPEEKIYLFLYREAAAKKKDDMREQLYLFSAFADCLDLSRGQERPYTILQETKENAKTKQSEVLYTHPSYKKELEQ